MSTHCELAQCLLNSEEMGRSEFLGLSTTCRAFYAVRRADYRPDSFIIRQEPYTVCGRNHGRMLSADVCDDRVIIRHVVYHYGKVDQHTRYIIRPDSVIRQRFSMGGDIELWITTSRCDVGWIVAGRPTLADIKSMDAAIDAFAHNIGAIVRETNGSSTLYCVEGTAGVNVFAISRDPLDTDLDDDVEIAMTRKRLKPADSRWIARLTSKLMIA